MKKPAWIIEKEQKKRASANQTVWLFGLHAVSDALRNPSREKLRLVLTRNAADRIDEAVKTSGMTAEITDPRKFKVPLDPGSVHQGAAIEVKPLDWGGLDGALSLAKSRSPIVVALDRVSDPHNVGAILRSSEVFGADAVIAPFRHSCPETGALAKSASGALERQPYVRVKNLGNALESLKKQGFRVFGLDEFGTASVTDGLGKWPGPTVIVLGSEGPGLRQRTKELCDELLRIDPAKGFGSLNVSNAAAVALFSASLRK